MSKDDTPREASRQGVLLCLIGSLASQDLYAYFLRGVTLNQRSETRTSPEALAVLSAQTNSGRPKPRVNVPSVGGTITSRTTAYPER
jgi:hypothetical protein